MQKQLKFKKLHPKAKLPTRGTDSAAGYDLYLSEDLETEGTFGVSSMAKFGVAVEIPEGYCGLLLARSSLHKKGIRQSNSVGIIDSDYRGELMAPMEGIESYIPEGTRIAQLVIVPIFQAEPTFVDELEDSDRGTGGFGSTGA